MRFNKYKYRQILSQFHTAFGVVFFVVTLWKIIVEKRLFFHSSFVSFYFASFIIWAIWLLLAIIESRKDNQ